MHPPEPPLPAELFRAEQVRAMDRHAITELGIPGMDLMQRAAAAAFAALQQRWPSARTLSVLCGAGNNGGDGYLLACLAQQAGWDVRAYPLAPPQRLRGDAATAFEEFRAGGGPLLDFVPADFEGAEVVADGLLGTGLDRPVSGPYADVIDALNRYRGGVLSLDIPSGLHADTGAVLGRAVRAKVTVSFIALKAGLFTGDGPDHAGQVVYADLATPAAVRSRETPAARLLPAWGGGLPPRPRNSHKGLFGHVLLLGGDHGYSGAVRLAAEAAVRCGAGLVSIGTRPRHSGLVNLTRPELMSHGIHAAADLETLLQRASVVAVGPGLGRSDWSCQLLDVALESGLPLVVDADALNLLAQRPPQPRDWVLTPHPGEAARLLGCDTGTVQRDRFAAVAELQKRYGGTIVLKGCGTLVLGAGGPVGVCRQGNPGMASGGMGDVLTGVIAALAAQGLALAEAAAAGVALHAAAADQAAAAGGERGLLAGDVIAALRRLVNR